MFYNSENYDKSSAQGQRNKFGLGTASKVKIPKKTIPFKGIRIEIKNRTLRIRIRIRR